MGSVEYHPFQRGLAELFLSFEEDKGAHTIFKWITDTSIPEEGQ